MGNLANKFSTTAGGTKGKNNGPIKPIVIPLTTEQAPSVEKQNPSTIFSHFNGFGDLKIDQNDFKKFINPETEQKKPREPEHTAEQLQKLLIGGSSSSEKQNSNGKESADSTAKVIYTKQGGHELDVDEHTMSEHQSSEPKATEYTKEREYDQT